MTVTKGFLVTLSGESIEDKLGKDLDLPKDAKLLKIVPAHGSYNGWDFLFLSEKGFEIAEANDFPRVGSKTDLPKGDAEGPEEVKEGPEDVKE